MIKTYIITISVLLGLFLGCENPIKNTNQIVENEIDSRLVGAWHFYYADGKPHYRALMLNSDGTGKSFEKVSDEDFFLLNDGDTHYYSYEVKSTFGYRITGNKLICYEEKDIVKLVECSGLMTSKVTIRCGTEDNFINKTFNACSNWESCIICSKQEQAECLESESWNEIFPSYFSLSKNDSILNVYSIEDNIQQSSVFLRKIDDAEIHGRRSGIVNISLIDWNE